MLQIELYYNAIRFLPAVGMTPAYPLGILREWRWLRRCHSLLLTKPPTVIPNEAQRSEESILKRLMERR